MRRLNLFSGLIFKALCIVLLFIYLPASAKAWGLLGHRIVGEIAEKYLSKKARQEITKILGTETVALASTWADFIRSDTAYKYLEPWHYINLDRVNDYNDLKAHLQNDTAADAYARINFLVAQLKNKSLAPAKKLLYLRLLIHIAGDVHQPFHVSVKGDMGGNGLKVLWFGLPSNIHRVWDEQLIDFQKLSYTEYVRAINFVSAEQVKRWQKDPVSKWLFESYTISEQLRNDLTQPEPKLSYGYNFDNISIVNDRLLKAGVRLAGLLNSIFI